MRSVPNSSKQPVWTPASMTIGSPASTWMMNGATKFSVMSASPPASAFAVPRPPSRLRYWTSVKPSAARSSPATYCGAIQMPGIWISLSVEISGGCSASTRPACRLGDPAAPARIRPRRNCRRLEELVCRESMGPPAAKLLLGLVDTSRGTSEGERALRTTETEQGPVEEPTLGLLCPCEAGPHTAGVARYARAFQRGRQEDSHLHTLQSLSQRHSFPADRKWPILILRFQPFKATL